MHDRNGTPLAKGDRVLIEATITELQTASDDYCNVAVETVAGRRPDGAKERVYSINTGVLTLLARSAAVLALLAVLVTATVTRADEQFLPALTLKAGPHEDAIIFGPLYYKAHDGFPTKEACETFMKEDAGFKKDLMEILPSIAKEAQEHPGSVLDLSCQTPGEPV